MDSDLTIITMDGDTPVPDVTLRDRFAMAALTGMLASETEDSTYGERHAAERAYAMADAMLAAREVGK